MPTTKKYCRDCPNIGARYMGGKAMGARNGGMGAGGGPVGLRWKKCSLEKEGDKYAYVSASG